MIFLNCPALVSVIMISLQRPILLPWPVWLSGLDSILPTERSLVRFPVREHAWVASSVPS